MKRWLVLLAAALLCALCACAAADGERWICAVCGYEAENNYCSMCSAPRPDAQDAEMTREKDGVTYTLTGWEESDGIAWYRPAEGRTYLLITMVTENRSAAAVNLSSIVSYETYCDGKRIYTSMGAQMEAEHDADAVVDPGETQVTTIGYEVPADWKTIEMHIRPNMFLDERVSFTITHP